MKILIFGGTGLIGRAFIPVLLKAGHSVQVLSRSPQAVRLPPEVQVLGWDGHTGQGWQQLVAHADALVNLAGENIGGKLWTNKQKELIRSSRVQAGQAIVAAVQAARQAANQRPRVLLQASAVGCYGIHGDEGLDETSPGGSDFLSNICVDWENSTRPVEQMGVRRVLLRTGLVLSLRGGVLPRLLLPFRLFVGGPLGSGRQWYSWIHLADQVAAMLFLLENEQAQGGVYNLTAPNPVTMADFGRAVGKVLRCPYWFPTPAFALHLALGEMSTLVLDGQRVLPKKLLDGGFRFRFEHVQDALTDLFTG